MAEIYLHFQCARYGVVFARAPVQPHQCVRLIVEWRVAENIDIDVDNVETIHV